MIFFLFFFFINYFLTLIFLFLADNIIRAGLTMYACAYKFIDERDICEVFLCVRVYEQARIENEKRKCTKVRDTLKLYVYYY